MSSNYPSCNSNSLQYYISSSKISFAFSVLTRDYCCISLLVLYIYICVLILLLQPAKEELRSITSMLISLLRPKQSCDRWVKQVDNQLLIIPAGMASPAIWYWSSWRKTCPEYASFNILENSNFVQGFGVRMMAPILTTLGNLHITAIIWAEYVAGSINYVIFFPIWIVLFVATVCRLGAECCSLFENLGSGVAATKEFPSL